MPEDMGASASADRAGGPADLSRSTASQPEALIPCAGEPLDWKWQGPHGLELAIIQFKLALPGWWFSVGECQVSADASCGPTRESEHLALIGIDRRFDDGFHADLPQPATLADALKTVQQAALGAIAIAIETQRAETENTGSVAKR